METSKTNTQFVFCETIQTHTLRELISLATNDDRYGVLLCHHGHKRRTRTRKDGTIGVDGMSADQNNRNFRNNRTQGRQKQVGAWYGSSRKDGEQALS
jgi:hypothetical protein